MIVYGRNAVREALRGRRQVLRVWATSGAADEPWLGRAAGVPVELARGQEIEERCGSDGHQGVCAEVTPYPYVGAAELLAKPSPLIVALDEIQDVQNLGAICRTAECVGATGVVIPERRSAEVTAAVCKASAGAVEHLPVARVRNLADFLEDAKRASCWCYGAAAGRAPSRTTNRTTRAGSCSSWARRAAACASGWPNRATSSSRCRSAGRSTRST